MAYRREGTHPPIDYHVENGAKPGGLVQGASGVTVDGIEETRDTICDRAVDGVMSHTKKGHPDENDTGVAWWR
jgi:hypothetical protein